MDFIFAQIDKLKIYDMAIRVIYKNMKRFNVLLVSILFNIGFVFSQQIEEIDKCGGTGQDFKSTLETLGDYWGYGYNDLLEDLTDWKSSDFVKNSIVGESTLNRNIYELTITDTTITETDKKRIYIHARTHPGEVQAFWVTNGIINLLLDNGGIGEYMRKQCLFHIVPMYNPDGVELEYPRENANGVDIESNWNSSSPEAEVYYLQKRFKELMQKDNPIEIALNMHSAVACKRYFVYHHKNGTSANYANREESYIESIRSHFYDGIEPYDYYISWANGTPTQYPESWWWNNYNADVMALTYEDMNCSSAGFYDKTAYAILYGISDYLSLGFEETLSSYSPLVLKAKAWPNPFVDYVVVEWNDFNGFDKARVVDMMGRTIKEFQEAAAYNGTLTWDGTNSEGVQVPTGIYIFQLVKDNSVKNITLMKR